MTVHRRPFGRTGWDISEVSYGAWQLGGQWGHVDDDASVRSLLTAYESGINFVDTAQMYGSGHSEEVIGRSLREWRGERIYVASKVQPPKWPHPSVDDPDIAAAYRPEYLRDQAEQSLRRLGVERIDLYQLHCWMPSGMRDLGWLETLHELRDEGKIDRIGVSLRDYRADEGVALAESGLVDSIQVIHNIFEQRPEEALYPAAAASGTAIIVRVALDSGSLSGAWTPDTYDQWEDDSVVKTMFRGERFTETLARVEAIKAVTAPHYAGLDEAAIRFVLDRPEVSTAIVGMSSDRRIARNLSFADGRGLVSGLREQLAPFNWERNFYV
ncbi:aryl-alcohol dehydrogenase-like predicted oxidoreductase [Microbacterium ginsengiterrae]|uniref:Aryl-alcohol dehydrogenase-like predicted oxidoreductase n=1 Tax=Microbacterium ginsengiterrae TaxID=546115 RepID=A0A7W9FD68_9MICO|nr:MULTISPECIES: aldo/keto reductase [Microbacterium]MBB5743188.1 aryl-alcohol dehydrogenase-like predicted oxidoreductase [Microbacterium ginsengiterrae]